MSQSDLERRIAELERNASRTRSLPWTMLALVVGMMIASVMQYRINTSLKKQLRGINRIEATTELTHAK